jgi:ribonuclease I
MMSKHGGDKKRQWQAEPPIREGNEGPPRDSGGSVQRTGAEPNHPASPAAPTSSIIPPEQIAVRAYENWEARGKPAGTDREDWFEADRQLQEEIRHPSLENVTGNEANPAGIGKRRLSGAIPHQTSDAAAEQARESEEREAHDVAELARRFAATEQTRDAKESEEARSAGASNRERMVDIGRGNQQAGRQGQ